MKPNDKAFEAALAALKNMYFIGNKNLRGWAIKIVTDAYAAQFPPSEEYAGLVKELRAFDDAIAERDALAARLAPVDDKALVEIGMQAAYKAEYGTNILVHPEEINFLESIYKPIITAAIAAIRPHIEAAERERCAKTCRELDKQAEAAGAAYPSGIVCALEIMKSP